MKSRIGKFRKMQDEQCLNYTHHNLGCIIERESFNWILWKDKNTGKFPDVYVMNDIKRRRKWKCLFFKPYSDF